MSLLQICRAVIGNPDVSAGLLRYQNLKREIDGDARGSQHQRRAGFRTAENDKLGRTRFQPNLLGFIGMVNYRKDGYPLPL